MELVGLGRNHIEHRLEAELLQPVYHAVFTLGPRGADPLMLPVAALLAGGATAVLSHHTAAALHQLRPQPPGIADITIPGKRRASRKGLRIHSGALAPHETDLLDALPVTSVPRTLTDLATVLPRADTHRLVNDAIGAGLATFEELQAGATSSPVLRDALAHDDATNTRRPNERKLRRLLREAGLPGPEPNPEVAGYVVDLLWRPERLVAEFDSWRYHADPGAFERDRRRHNDILAAGFGLIRITQHDLDREPLALVARLARELAYRSAAGQAMR